MYKIKIIQYDPEIMRCNFDGINIESNEEISVDDINQFHCEHGEGYIYNGLAPISDPDNIIVYKLPDYFKQSGEDPTSTLTLVPVFDGLGNDEIIAKIMSGEADKSDKSGEADKSDKSGEKSQIIIDYKNNKYTVNTIIPTTVRNVVSTLFPSDYDTDNIRIKQQSTGQTLTINDTIDEKDGIYTVEFLDPLITFKVDGNIIKFKDYPSATEKSLPLSKVRMLDPIKVTVADHYVFNGWSGDKGNWNSMLYETLDVPATFEASSYLKRWNVTFTDCGENTTMIVTDGDYVTSPKCTKEGHTFQYWREKFSVTPCNAIIFYLLIIVFIICAIVLFMPIISYVTRGVQPKPSY